MHETDSCLLHPDDLLRRQKEGEDRLLVDLVAEIAASENQFQLATYKKMPIAAERGDGVWIYASDGERYLDLYGGHAVAATGHCHPQVVKALREQSEKLLFYSNLVYSEARARAAEELVSVAPDPMLSP